MTDQEQAACEQAIRDYAAKKHPRKRGKPREKAPEPAPAPLPPGNKTADIRAYMAEYKRNHKAEIYANRHKYYLAHREKELAYQAEHRRKKKGGASDGMGKGDQTSE